MKPVFLDRFLVISLSVLVLAVVGMVALVALRGAPIVIVPSTTVTVTGDHCSEHYGDGDCYGYCVAGCNC